MEIRGKNTNNALDTYIKNIDASKKIKQTPQQPAPATQNEGDKVELSAQAKQIQAAGELIKSYPEIREEKVAEIRHQIQAGTYRIDAGKIANAMLKEAFSDGTS